jgi:MFS family permease
MLARFCLYGFLKNQRYFEPFFMLALLAHQLSFTEIGVLVACRSLTLNLLEIPSGAMADLWGRRRCMIASFVAYVVSFLTFAWAPSAGWLYPAMVLFGIGDSFRTGTHKAMIFEWLRNQGREQERTRVYGLTRSWSKYGSAVSAVLASVFVLSTGDFRSVFLFATIPYAINIFNFLGYPAELDGYTPPQAEPMSKRMEPIEPKSNHLGIQLGETLSALRNASARSGIRRLIAESMCWEGVYNSIHDYLQPALLVFTVGQLITQPDSELNELTAVSAAQNPTAVILITATYALLAILSGVASRLAHRFAQRSGTDQAAARLLWIGNLCLFGLLGFGDFFGAELVVVGAFIALGVLQNVWRPILISRFDDHSDPKWGATVLSIESQSQRLATLFIAPAVGYSVDLVVRQQWPGHFWPIAIVGIGAGLPMLLTASRRRHEALLPGRPEA